MLSAWPTKDASDCSASTPTTNRSPVCKTIAAPGQATHLIVSMCTSGIERSKQLGNNQISTLARLKLLQLLICHIFQVLRGCLVRFDFFGLFFDSVSLGSTSPSISFSKYGSACSRLQHPQSHSELSTLPQTAPDTFSTQTSSRNLLSLPWTQAKHNRLPA